MPYTNDRASKGIRNAGAAPLPPDEEQRLLSLRNLEILDTSPESRFDALVALASDICGTPIALISLIDRDRQWFKASVGMGETETQRDIAVCAHAILGDETLIIADAALDPRTAESPLVKDGMLMRFYAGAPLRTEGGHNVGTLCVIDRVPRSLTESQQRALRTLADQVETELALRAAAGELRRQHAELEYHRDALMRSSEAQVHS